MLSIIEKVKNLFKCKVKKKAKCAPQQGEKAEDKSQEQTGCSKKSDSN